jgi:hypothetical protein
VNDRTQSPLSTQRFVFSASSASSAFLLIAGCLLVACGKKGPPLPPLVKLPAAPAELTAQRRATTVDLQFIVPAANTDGTRPANVERVDVYAITGGRAFTDDQILKLGTKVASVDVKAPRDPDATTEPDQPDEEVDPPEGKGLDQGVVARVTEQLTDQTRVPVIPPKDKKVSRRDEEGSEGPLLPPSMLPPARTYVGVGISTRGRKGPLSTRVSVPLAPPPPVPAPPTASYDEKAITVVWDPIAGGDGSDHVLPSTPLGAPQRSLAFNVYVGTDRLTKTPVGDPTFVDTRVTWGEERCYVVRAAEKIDDTVVESAATSEACVTPVDTFPPAAPKQLQSVASVGAITLIWEPNTERDLAGYLVLRGGSERELQPITTSPITATQFKDDVAPGTRYVYAVLAVDKAGNSSALSNLAEDTAR